MSLKKKLDFYRNSTEGMHNNWLIEATSEPPTQYHRTQKVRLIVKDVGFLMELQGTPKVRLGVPTMALHNGTPSFNTHFLAVKSKNKSLPNGTINCRAT